MGHGRCTKREDSSLLMWREVPAKTKMERVLMGMSKARCGVSFQGFWTEVSF